MTLVFQLVLNLFMAGLPIYSNLQEVPVATAPKASETASKRKIEPFGERT